MSCVAEPALNRGVELFKRYLLLSEDPHQVFKIAGKPQAVIFSQQAMGRKDAIAEMVYADMHRHNKCLVRMKS